MTVAKKSTAKKSEKSGVVAGQKLLTLGNLSPSKGANKSKKRLGRGTGSGTGKTAGKGHKGQKARKSAVIPAGFEGGQTPLYRRLPKRGFVNIHRKDYQIVSLESLANLSGKVGPSELKSAGLIRKINGPIKVLSSGEFSTSGLEISVHKISESAKAKVEAAGSKVSLIQKVSPES